MLTQELGSSSSDKYSMWVPEYHGLRILIVHTLEEARSFGENPRNSIMERETKGATKATLLIAPKSSIFF